MLIFGAKIQIHSLDFFKVKLAHYARKIVKYETFLVDF